MGIIVVTYANNIYASKEKVAIFIYPFQYNTYIKLLE